MSGGEQEGGAVRKHGGEVVWDVDFMGGMGTKGQMVANAGFTTALPLSLSLSLPLPQCVKVLLSLLWWMPNEVYWINYGCQRMDGEKWTWVRPCPAHAICSWIKSLDSGNETPYCPADANYRKPQ